MGQLAYFRRDGRVFSKLSIGRRGAREETRRLNDLKLYHLIHNYGTTSWYEVANNVTISQ